MKTYKIIIITILFCAAIILCAAASAAEEGSVLIKCLVCGKEMKPEWKYCPYDGTLLVSKKIEDIPERAPKDVLLVFYQAYKNKDKKALEECIDFEYILKEILTKGIDNIQGLTSDMKATLKAKLIPIASKSLISAIIDVMVSDSMHKEFPVPEEISFKALDAFYEMKVEGNIARFLPLKGMGVDEQIVLRKTRGRWFIIEMPGI